MGYATSVAEPFEAMARAWPRWPCATAGGGMPRRGGAYESTPSAAKCGAWPTARMHARAGGMRRGGGGGRGVWGPGSIDAHNGVHARGGVNDVAEDELVAWGEVTHWVWLWVLLSVCGYASCVRGCLCGCACALYGTPRMHGARGRPTGMVREKTACCVRTCLGRTSGGCDLRLDAGVSVERGAAVLRAPATSACRVFERSFEQRLSCGDCIHKLERRRVSRTTINTCQLS